MWKLAGVSGPTPLTYKTENQPACSQALKRRGLLMIWAAPGMDRVAPQAGGLTQIGDAA